MKIKITKEVHNMIVKQLLYNTSEMIGIIGSTGNNTIDKFLFDARAVSEKYYCKLSFPCSSVFSRLTRAYFVGIVHSHPPGKHMLSDADIIYAQKIISASKSLQFIIMGIVSDYSLYLYLVRISDVTSLDLFIIE